LLQQSEFLEIDLSPTIPATFRRHSRTVKHNNKLNIEGQQFADLPEHSLLDAFKRLRTRSYST
jgi:hypothetical protein